MSLFLGNLPPHVRHPELERVFGRFGRSTIQLKDGYGFVIFDDPKNAERALRALRGKLICGERISLTWSNRQPGPFHRFTKGTQILESQHGRNVIWEGDRGARNRSSQDNRDFVMDDGDYLNEDQGKKEYGNEICLEHVEGEQNLKERVLDDSIIALEPNPLENDRWGAVGDSLNNNAVETGTEFDCYEPYHGFSKRDDSVQQQRTISYDSEQGGSPGRARREHSNFDNPKFQRTCYNCGMMGHKVRNCPKGDSLRRGFGHLQDGGIDFRGRSERQLRKQRYTSWGRLSARNSRLSRRHANERKEAGSWKARRLGKGIKNFPENRRKHWSQFKRDSQGTRRRRKEHESPKLQREKKRRSSDSSLLHSNSSTASRSCSSSSKSESGISSHSYNVPMSSASPSISSSSRSAASYSRSHSSRSRSRSSSSRSLSLSVSLDRQSPSSSKKNKMELMVTSPKDGLKFVTASQSENPKSEHFSLEQKVPLGDLGSEYFEHKQDCNLEQRSPLDEMHTSECDFIANNSSLRNFMDIDSLQKPETLHINSVRSPLKMVPIECQTSGSTRMSSQEVFKVLKLYGLKAPDESEILHLSMDAFFGAARLWPWEMVYYRRLKKGLISTENYARRVAQNQEFGIVDKYIRSSSNWGAFDGNNC